MTLLDLTLPTPAANLACDEALLDACENQTGGEVLRFWESPEYFVVVGFSNAVATEVNVDACQRNKIGIYRRCSGGGAVLQGPGCLNYTLVLNIESNAGLATITAANRHIMGRHRQALAELPGRPVEIQGHTDLVVDGLKFSGNAQRRKRRALVFHGTFLLNFDLARIEQYLCMPSREPEYRQHRPHRKFLTNLGLPPETVKTILCETWAVTAPLRNPPDYRPLAAEKYSRDEWNLKF